LVGGADGHDRSREYDEPARHGESMAPLSVVVPLNRFGDHAPSYGASDPRLSLAATN
jgi:hypothetical protein